MMSNLIANQTSHHQYDLATNASILMVSEDATSMFELEEFLFNSGYLNVEIATNLTDITRLFELSHFDLVIVDEQVSPVLGARTCEFVRSESEHTDFPSANVVLFAQGTLHEIPAYHTFDEVLVSPLNPVEVNLRISNLLKNRIHREESDRIKDELETKLLGRTKQLYETQLKLIDYLSQNIDNTPKQVGSTDRLIGRYVSIVGKAMGLSDQECDLLEQASPLHDLGNIGIPDEVLLKNGKLSDKDMAIVRKHVEIGANLLSSSDNEMMKVAATIAETHHERWDGNGYPSGLKGQQIPLCSRIVAVCDVFNALTSNRPHRPSWRVSKALEYLKKNAGSQFDPDVVRSFQAVINEVLACRENILKLQGFKRAMQ
ncbi:response regulator [Sessilibacter corallicola]|uniref:Two-component system response regulator n=1 Tax=Sessilibacter corallicola TaxID=2904075 RepID=A0ABQ0A8T1_9GAMM|nr:HD domain-containing phosphohydrolase [Sessilibacter corallicola]MCE2030515.1 HD domain-containing protein [Sessilibacter corallicola]